MLSSDQQAEVDRLRLENDALRQENATLKQRLGEDKSVRRQCRHDNNHYVLQTRELKEGIRSIDKDASVLAQHDELQKLRDRCAVYAEAIEESRNYFFELKRLYSEMEPYLGPKAV